LETKVKEENRLEENKIYKIFNLLGRYVSLNSSYLPTFPDKMTVPLKMQLTVPKFRELTTNQHCVTSRRAKISFTPRWKLEITHRKFVICRYTDDAVKVAKSRSIKYENKYFGRKMFLQIRFNAATTTFLFCIQTFYGCNILEWSLCLKINEIRRMG